MLSLIDPIILLPQDKEPLPCVCCGRPVEKAVKHETKRLVSLSYRCDQCGSMVLLRVTREVAQEYPVDVPARAAAVSAFQCLNDMRRARHGLSGAPSLLYRLGNLIAMAEQDQSTDHDRRQDCVLKALRIVAAILNQRANKSE